MNIKEIKELVNILENSTLSTLELSEEGKTIKLGKKNENTIENFKTTQDEKQVAEDIIEEHSKEIKDAVKSPMVGVFYSKPSPDDKPYVSVGTRVTRGQTLCIIEAMKLMNEITAHRDGIISKVFPKDGELVEFGQDLFLID